MNGTSGFEESRSSPSRSPSPEQRHRLGTGAWHLLHTHHLSALFTDTSAKREKAATTFSVSRSLAFIVGTLLIGTGSGCTFFMPPASEEKLNAKQAYWFHYEASRRGGFLVPTDSSGNSYVKMCAEPAPDVALARSAEFVAKGVYQGATAEAQAKLSEQLAQLGGRTQTVLILRESLFRLCELSINGGLPSERITTLYTDVVQAVIKLAEADLENAQAAATKAKAELMKAETERMSFINSINPTPRQQSAPQ